MKSRTRNEMKKIADFCKEAGISNYDCCERPGIGPSTGPPQAVEEQVKQKKNRDVEPSQLKHTAIDPKKLKKLHKIAFKEKEIRQRLDLEPPLDRKPILDDAVHLLDVVPNLYKDKEVLVEPKSTRDNSQGDDETRKIVTNQKIPAPGYIYPSCVNKSYDRFYGYFGHCPVLTNRRVIEGHYYLEVKILKHKPLEGNIKGKFNMDLKTNLADYQPSVRIGIADAEHKPMTPLGGPLSYCLQSRTGNILHNGTVIQQTQCRSFEPQDIIGVELVMSPPLPVDKSDRSPPRINHQSHLNFYKNGQKIASIQNIQQCYYVFAVSLYNWANVQFNMGPDFHSKPENARPYCDIYTQKVLYKDIKLQ